MEELNTPIFAQAKVEYTSQLVDILYSHMFDGVKSIYDESKIIYSSRTGTPILLLFRELLEKVPIWNGEIIDSECSRIINNSKCDWIDDLITAVFISHTKILTSIGPNQSFQKINVTIPKTSTFIHKSYINTARELWKNPYLFNESVPAHEFQRNNKEIENIIKKSIEKTIRNLLPIKEILKEHLDGETDSILNQKETLKQLLRDELQNILPKSSFNRESGSVRDMGEDEGTEEVEGVEEVEGTEEVEGRIMDKTLQINEVIEERVSDHNTSVSPGPSITNENNDTVQGSVSDVGSPMLTDKLELIADKERRIMEELNKIDIQTSEAETFTSSGDPTEAQVTKNCSDIIVNDITMPVDMPVDMPTSHVTVPKESVIPGPVVEIKYDNVNLAGDTLNIDQDRIKRLMTTMEVKEEVNVIKSNETASSLNNTSVDVSTKQVAPFSFNNLYQNTTNTSSAPIGSTVTPPNDLTGQSPMVTPPNDLTGQPPMVTPPMVTPLQIISEDKPSIITEPKSPRKEMVIVKNEDDIDETSSLANFFDDMKKIVEEKGIKVETNQEKTFTLFEDASEVEK